MPTGNELMALGCGRGDNYLSIPTASYHVSTPSSAALLPGSSTIDLRARVSMATWVPAGNSFLVSKFGSEYGMYIDSAGRLNGVWTNPAAVGQFCVGGTTGVAAGGIKWARVLMNPGVGGGTCDFYTSDDAAVWTAIGAQVTGKTTTGVIVPGSPATLRAGETDAGGGQWANAAAKIFRAMVLIGGVLVSDIDFTAQAVGSTNTTFVANTGETWTIANSAVIV